MKHRLHHIPVLLGSLLIGSSSLAQATRVPQVQPAGAKTLASFDRADLGMAHGEALRQIRATDGGHWARNPGQRWSTQFDGEGFLVQPDHGAWSWGLGLESYGFDEAQEQVQGKAHASAAADRVAYDWTSNVQEWYINGADGLEHGYTLRNRPGGSAGDGAALSFTLSVRGSLAARVVRDGQAVQFLNSEGSVALTYSGLHVYDSRGVKQDSIFTGAGSEIRIEVDESSAVYPLTVDPTAQQAYLKASNTEADDRFGHRVDVSGDWAVVGAPGEDGSDTGMNGNQSSNAAFGAGAAYLYRRNAGSWTQVAYVKPGNIGGQYSFGSSVAISGNRMVIGSPGERGSATGVNGVIDTSAFFAGAAYVFSETGGVWSQEAYLKPSNTEVADTFGGAVAIDGDLIVVGSTAEDGGIAGVNGNDADNSVVDAGAAYLFRLGAGGWSQEAYLKASNPGVQDHFGESVSVSGDRVVIGASSEDGSLGGVNANGADNGADAAGAAYVFARSGGVWSQEAYLKASNPDADDRFARGVAVSGSRIAICAAGEDSNSVGMNGDQNDNSMQSAGAAYIFEYSGGAWSQTTYVKPTNTGLFDLFGTSIAMEDDRIVVGAKGEASPGTGVNPGDMGNTTDDSGAAYVYVYEAGSWTRELFLKASNPEGLDWFGSAVAISADSIVVGAVGERSASTGVNGDGSDNSAANAGAAYVFGLEEAAANYCNSVESNSSGLPGAISMSGSVVVSDNAFSLHADGLPQNQMGFFLNSPGQNYVASPGGSQGAICVGGIGTLLGRHNRPSELRDSGAGGSFSLTLDLTDLPTALGVHTVSAGETWNFQAWFRDMNPGLTSNFTNAISVRFE